MGGEEREKILSADELRDAVRAVQRECLERLEQECVEREAFRKATTKLPPQQKRILRWMWVETRKWEAYLEENDVHDPELRKHITRLDRKVNRSAGESPGGVAERQAVEDYYHALFFVDSGSGLSWSNRSYCGA